MNYQLHSQDYYDPSLELDFTQPWSPDSKKHGQIPRAASYYPASQSAVFGLADDDWQYAHPVHYTDNSPPRIKQEDLYSDASIRYDQTQPLSQSQTQPQTQSQSYQSVLAPLHASSYYSPSFHHQPHPLNRSSFQPFAPTIHPSELSPVTDSCPSVSPLSAYTDLSTVVNVPHDSHYVCQPQHTLDLKSWNDDRRSSLASTASLESDLSSQSHHSHMVGLDMNMDPMHGMALGLAGVVVGGMPIDMSGPVSEVCVPEEDVGGEEDAEGDDDWDHAQPQDPQQQAQYQQQPQQIEYGVEVGEDETERDGEGEDELHIQADSSIQQHQQQPQNGVDEDGEDEIPVEESDLSEDVEGEAEAEIKREYEDSDLSETDEEEEDEDDPDDPEFVPRPRRRPNLRRQSTFPAADGELHYHYGSTVPFSNIMNEGRNLRSRSSSARYTPYPSSYPEASSTSFYSTEHGFEHHGSDNGGAYNERASGRRYNSTSSATSSSTQPPRSASSLSGSSGITTTTTTTRRRLRPSNTLPVPVPVPNLTKKSRGRRVPTMSSLEDVRSATSGAGRKRQSAGGKSARMYLCDVDGCGKCFARGEHLKRHVRSIHTYEKPHKCLYPGCGKDFSRHDNLGQHMRVHKDYVQEGVTVPNPVSSGSSSTSSRRKSTAQTQS